MKRKILIIGPGMGIGGVERSLLSLLDSIDYSENEVDLFLLSHTGEWMTNINKNVRLLPERKSFALISWPICRLFLHGHLGMVLIRLVCKAVGDIRARITKTKNISIPLCKRVAASLQKPLDGEYDLALGFFAPHDLLLRRVNARTKIGWVHTDYCSEKQDTAFFFPMWRGLDRIACVSESVKASFDSVYPELADRTIVAENILSSDFVRAQADAADVGAEMPDDGAFRILSVGRFCTAKAFDEAILAAERLRAGGADIKWYFIGYGPDELKMRNLITDIHAEEYAVILGKKENPYPYMKACDLYVQPSRYEGKAVTVREAQMLGKPVLITDFATAGSQLEDGVDGHICPMGIDGVVSGVRYMMEHPEYRERLASNAGSRDYSNAEEAKKLIDGFSGEK